MPNPFEVCLAEDNHRWLIEQFARILASYEPKDVVDVGCGAGRLLMACRERGIDATGLDMPGPRLDAVAEAGFSVREGNAYDLGMADRSTDWLVLRHVPHHLEHPARAFGELLRVADRGVVIAEPFYDVSVPSQRGAVLLDLWEKRQHRRRGMYHEPVYDLAALQGMLPAGYEREFAVEVHMTLRLRSSNLDDVRKDADRLVDDLDASDPEHATKAQLLAELEKLGLSWNGSLLMTLTRR
jgi:SAM-dependent methyltransferase